jgi:hypothetical protein
MSFVISLLLFTSTAFAYIPNVDFILDRTGKNHGKDSYRIVKEVVFRSSESDVALTEYWIIESGQSMTVYVKGKNASLRFLYKNGKKYWLENGQLNQATYPLEFSEGAFHSRTHKDLAKYLVHNQLAPRDIIRKSPIPYTIHAVKHASPEYLRLSRFGNVVNFAFSPEPLTKEKRDQPGVWIEQDRFVLRRFKYPSGAEMVANAYREFAKNKWYPAEREIKFGDSIVPIRTLELKKIQIKKEQKEALSLNKYTQKKYPDNNFSDLGTEVRDFYKRFR